MKSYKKLIREIMQMKIDECNEWVNDLTQKARKILNSNSLDWPKIGKMSQQVIIVLCKCSILEELITVKKPKKVTEITMADVMLAQKASTGHL